MSVENKIQEPNKPYQQENKESFNLTLDELLTALQQEGVNTLSAEEIKNQLDKTGEAIVTRDFNCGIRISRSGSKNRGYQYRTWTTNKLEDPNHPLSQRFARKDITI